MRNYFFWSIFFLLFILFLLPTANYLVTGFPDFLDRNEITDKLWFSAHILSGFIVYLVAPFQFSSSARNRNPKRHKMLGRVLDRKSVV